MSYEHRVRLADGQVLRGWMESVEVCCGLKKVYINSKVKCFASNEFAFVSSLTVRLL